MGTVVLGRCATKAVAACRTVRGRSVATMAAAASVGPASKSGRSTAWRGSASLPGAVLGPGSPVVLGVPARSVSALWHPIAAKVHGSSVMAGVRPAHGSVRANAAGARSACRHAIPRSAARMGAAAVAGSAPPATPATRGFAACSSARESNAVQMGAATVVGNAPPGRCATKRVCASRSSDVCQRPGNLNVMDANARSVYAKRTCIAVILNGTGLA